MILRTNQYILYNLLCLSVCLSVCNALKTKNVKNILCIFSGGKTNFNFVVNIVLKNMHLLYKTLSLSVYLCDKFKKSNLYEGNDFSVTCPHKQFFTNKNPYSFYWEEKTSLCSLWGELKPSGATSLQGLWLRGYMNLYFT